MVFPVQMSQDVVDAAFGCLRLSREQKPKFSKTKCFCISTSCSTCTVVGNPSKGTKWKLFSGKCLRDVVDAANHCLWAHTCLKLPFSFMSPLSPSSLHHTQENTNSNGTLASEFNPIFHCTANFKIIERPPNVKYENGPQTVYLPLAP